MSSRLRKRGRDPTRRGGFTLIELLVVVVIIAMLMAMLFPAFNSVIEAVRKNACGSKLHDLTLLANLYHLNTKAYPKSSTKPVVGAQAGSQDQQTGGYSWEVALLGLVDGEASFYQRLAIASSMEGKKQFTRAPFDPQFVDTQGGQGGGGDGIGRHFATYRQIWLECPSWKQTNAEPFISEAQEYEQLAEEGLGVATSSYVAMSGSSLGKVDPTAAQGGSSGSEEDTDRQGRPRPDGVIIYRRGRLGIKKTAIGDGETKTIMFTETREENYAAWMDGATSWVVGHDPNVQEPTRLSGNSGYLVGQKHALNVGPVADTKDAEVYYRQDFGSGEQKWAWGPSSFHSGGIVNHAMCQGATKPIVATGPAAISATVYMHLITRNGSDPGETLDDETIARVEGDVDAGDDGGRN